MQTALEFYEQVLRYLSRILISTPIKWWWWKGWAIPVFQYFRVFLWFFWFRTHNNYWSADWLIDWFCLKFGVYPLLLLLQSSCTSCILSWKLEYCHYHNINFFLNPIKIILFWIISCVKGRNFICDAHNIENTIISSSFFPDSVSVYSEICGLSRHSYVFC